MLAIDKEVRLGSSASPAAHGLDGVFKLLNHIATDV